MSGSGGVFHIPNSIFIVQVDQCWNGPLTAELILLNLSCQNASFGYALLAIMAGYILIRLYKLHSHCRFRYGDTSHITMATKESVPPCEFDRLFTKSVPHILEGIFFSLDYDSFMACRAVCKAWNQLHSSELYQKEQKKMLVEKKKNEEKLCEYSKEGNVEEVHNLLSCGVNPSFSRADGLGRTPLIYASIHGHEDVVKLLLNMGADPIIATPWGYTPLHYAGSCSFASIGMVKLLLEAGADPNKADGNGDTPINWATKCGRTESVELLLEAGGEPNTANDEGETPLYWAANNGDQDLVKLLIDRGAKLNRATNEEEDTPLIMATIYGHTDVIQLLLNAGADPDKSNYVGTTPLHFAAQRGCQQAIKMLLSAGANPNKENFEGKNPLYLNKNMVIYGHLLKEEMKQK